jgi:hypothetical protein
VAVLALVAGCELISEIVSEEPKVAAPAPQPAPEPQQPPDDSTTVAATPPAPPPPASPPRERPAAPTVDFDPAKLVGLNKEETLSTLGQPAAVRDQPPATVWTYRTRECALDVFFYMDLATRAFRVLTTEVTSDLKSADARRNCLNRLRSASRGQ